MREAFNYAGSLPFVDGSKMEVVDVKSLPFTSGIINQPKDAVVVLVNGEPQVMFWAEDTSKATTIFVSCQLDEHNDDEFTYWWGNDGIYMPYSEEECWAGNMRGYVESYIDNYCITSIYGGDQEKWAIMDDLGDYCVLGPEGYSYKLWEPSAIIVSHDGVPTVIFWQVNCYSDNYRKCLSCNRFEGCCENDNE